MESNEQNFHQVIIWPYHWWGDLDDCQDCSPNGRCWFKGKPRGMPGWVKLNVFFLIYLDEVLIFFYTPENQHGTPKWRFGSEDVPFPGVYFSVLAVNFRWSTWCHYICNDYYRICFFLLSDMVTFCSTLEDGGISQVVMGWEFSSVAVLWNVFTDSILGGSSQDL